MTKFDDLIKSNNGNRHIIYENLYPC